MEKSQRERNAEVFGNPAFQSLAIMAQSGNADGLREKAYLIENMEAVHVKWLAFPAIKSHGTSALMALGEKIWDDETFVKDMLLYSQVVKNENAEKLIKERMPNEKS